MDRSDWSFIVIELVLIFGGALAFGWWQLRDLAREQAKRKAQKNPVPSPEAPKKTES